MQDVPQIWDAVVAIADDNANRKGQLDSHRFGYSKDRDAIHHSGTGRIARLRMWPMSLAESGESTGAVSLSDLFEGNSSLPNAILRRRHRQMVLLWRWPANLELDDEFA